MGATLHPLRLGFRRLIDCASEVSWPQPRVPVADNEEAAAASALGSFEAVGETRVLVRPEARVSCFGEENSKLGQTALIKTGANGAPATKAGASGVLTLAGTPFQVPLKWW